MKDAQDLIAEECDALALGLSKLEDSLANIPTDCAEHARRLGDGRCAACYQRAWVAKRRWIDATPGARELVAHRKAQQAALVMERRAKNSRDWRANNNDLARARDRARSKTERRRTGHRRLILEKKYGMTLDQYNDMLKSQGGQCAICRADDPGCRKNGTMTQWHVDHCHRTGRVRALLCTKCNTGLGLFNDDPALLVAAAEYARFHANLAALEHDHG